MYRNKPRRNQKLATAAIKSNFGQKQLLEMCIFRATIENCKSFLTMNWEASAPISSNKIARDYILNLLRFSASVASAAASKELAASFRLDQSYIAASWTGTEVQNPHKSHFSTLQCAWCTWEIKRHMRVSCLQRLEFFYSLRRHAVLPAVLLLHLKKTCGSLQWFFFSCRLLRPPYILQPLRQCDQAQ
jgi:hypothetical protein